MSNATKRPFYKISNMAQINAIELWFTGNTSQHHQALFNVIRYSHGIEFSSLINMRRADAISYVDLGVIITNNESKRTIRKRVPLSLDLDLALRRSISISHGEEYLFATCLFGSNIGASNKRPISRQSIWRCFRDATPALREATRNSGLSDKIMGFGAQSLINFEQGDEMLKYSISKMVSSFGDSISENLLSALRDEFAAIRNRSTSNHE